MGQKREGGERKRRDQQCGIGINAHLPIQTGQNMILEVTKWNTKGIFGMKATYVESLPGRDKSILGTALHGRDRAGQPKRERGRGKKNLKRRGFKRGFPTLSLI